MGQIYYKKTCFRIVYFISVIILWILLGMLLHWFLEYPVLYFLTKDFEHYSLGLGYRSWEAIHAFFSFMLLIASVLIGIELGKRWYNYVYIVRKGKLRHKK